MQLRRIELLFLSSAAALSQLTACGDTSGVHTENAGGAGNVSSGGAAGSGAGDGAGVGGSAAGGGLAGVGGIAATGGTSGTAGAAGAAGTAGGGIGGGGATGGVGGSGTVGIITSEGSGLNQCGAAAPLPADTGQCTLVTAPTITDFDDYAGGDAASYAFTVNSLGGAVSHVGDGSDASGSVIATEMIPGVGGAGYALRFSNSNALTWGGLLMVYFPGSATTLSCLDARPYGGVEFTVKGASPSGRVGVHVSMLDTIPTADSGLCTNPTATDCKDASVSYALPADPEAWTQIQIPWSAFTPGVGSETSCVPNNGQNIVRLVVQPFMNYAPPTFAYEPGPYSLAIDNVRFFGTPVPGEIEGTGGMAGAAGIGGLGGTAGVGGLAGAAGTAGQAGGGSCEFPASLRWSSAATPLIAPPSDATHDLVAIKDPTIVRFNDRYHVYASSVSTAGAYNMVYTSFADFSEAATAQVYHMDQTPGFDTYVAAPQLFYFTPQNKWYLVYQSGPPMYSTADDPGDPTTWTAPAPFYASTPAIVTQGGGGWLDYWIICDSASCHLFFSSNQGRWYHAKTAIGDFPNGFGEPVVVMENANSGRIFEASNVYKMNGANRYLALIEAFDQTSANHRYFRSWIADSLDGPWLSWQASGSYPFAGERNVTFDGTAWSHDISHGEMIRSGYDETLTIDPCNMQFLFQGTDPLADTGGDYNKIPWHLGLLSQAP